MAGAGGRRTADGRGADPPGSAVASRPACTGRGGSGREGRQPSPTLPPPLTGRPRTAPGYQIAATKSAGRHAIPHGTARRRPAAGRRSERGRRRRHGRGWTRLPGLAPGSITAPSVGCHGLMSTESSAVSGTLQSRSQMAGSGRGSFFSQSCSLSQKSPTVTTRGHHLKRAFTCTDKRLPPEKGAS